MSKYLKCWEYMVLGTFFENGIYAVIILFYFLFLNFSLLHVHLSRHVLLLMLTSSCLDGLFTASLKVPTFSMVNYINLGSCMNIMCVGFNIYVWNSGLLRDREVNSNILYFYQYHKSMYCFVPWIIESL